MSDARKKPRGKVEQEAIRQAISEYRALRNTRRCHDCGKPTSDYRCTACWAKRRGTQETAQDLAARRRLDRNFVYV